MPKAFRAKDEIERAYPDAQVLLVPKRGGYFDVMVEDKLIFSKTEKIGTPIERFPEVGEITALLKTAGY
ncbi:MAG: Rdx family protein [Sulfurospirillaceae bacterium]|nr:Rdx family protein [Sulfurospirillaceae bacterium]MDD2826446.1 Rdx family protein [Sulfurospirillaceae bacterium]